MEKYLKSIGSLMGRSFMIPKYQRGYRWGETEVTELLDDLWEFSEANPKPNEFYCLQPLVTVIDGDVSYVLDGQQRLTTIYLLLSYLEDRAKEDYEYDLFTIDYESRPNSKTYLAERRFKNEAFATTNIDYQQMKEAYRTIEQWFIDTKKHPGAKNKIIPLLLNEDGKGPNVRVIEYSPIGDNPIEVFLRLNSGKISLTDSELVKALLLQRDLYEDEQIGRIAPYLDTIAKEWHDIEMVLNDDKLWAFISPNKDYPDSRIELLLEQVAQDELRNYFRDDAESQIQEIWSRRKTPCFYSLDLVIQKDTREEDIHRVWEQIIMVFERIKEWYSDHELYHFIGYLNAISTESRLRHLLTLSKSYGVAGFKEKLKSEIGESVKAIDLKAITYNSSADKAKCTKVLLLHNVHTCILGGKEQARFPFDLYMSTKKKERWSLEHIHAQQSDVFPEKVEEQIQWLKANRAFINLEQEGNKQLSDDIDRLSEKDSDKIQEAAKRLFDLANDGAIPESQVDMLCNLCLLDQLTNSAISNDLFPLKRTKIIERDQAGKYIPLATKRAFLKAYTPHSLGNIRWSVRDAQAYFESIISAINFYK